MNDETRLPVMEVVATATDAANLRMKHADSVIENAGVRVHRMLSARPGRPVMTMAEIAEVMQDDEATHRALLALDSASMFRALTERKPVEPVAAEVPATLNMLAFTAYLLTACSESVARGFTPTGVIVMIPMDNGTTMLRSLNINLSDAADQLRAIANEETKELPE
jgi:hypothetical protein